MPNESDVPSDALVRTPDGMFVRSDLSGIDPILQVLCFSRIDNVSVSVKELVDTRLIGEQGNYILMVEWHLAKSDYSANNGTWQNLFTSKSPLSLSLSSGITSRAMKDNVIKGADIKHPISFTSLESFLY